MTSDQILDQAMRIDFFSRVGSHDIVKFGACEIIRVESWRQACEFRGSVAGSNAFLEASGRLTSTLSSNFRQEYRKWNSVIKSIDEKLNTEFISFLESRISGVAELSSIDWGPNFVKDTVVWDLVHYAAEQAYAEFVTPCFYTQIFKVYQDGRFPCHWDQVWPSGRFWVF